MSDPFLPSTPEATRLIESTECHLTLGEHHFIPGNPLPCSPDVAKQALRFPGVVDRTPPSLDPAPEAPHPLED